MTISELLTLLLGKAEEKNAEALMLVNEKEAVLEAVNSFKDKSDKAAAAGDKKEFDKLEKENAYNAKRSTAINTRLEALERECFIEDLEALEIATAINASYTKVHSSIKELIHKRLDELYNEVLEIERSNADLKRCMDIATNVLHIGGCVGYWEPYDARFYRLKSCEAYSRLLD